ncbi:Os10g0197300 [Oryza sativa Japonica Group]|uniref:Os10g0197300 protein n=1 Tax=Oryza sativa subsp. japonica TaxID=39947 RepID=A0A0N7KRJ8_ORYSJ|nr:Os10g0197300 [Oryza sativa Japonica Group]
MATAVVFSTSNHSAARTLGDVGIEKNKNETKRPMANIRTGLANGDAICRIMNSAIIKEDSARDLKMDGCGDNGFRQVQALSMKGNTLLLFGDLNPPGVY